MSMKVENWCGYDIRFVEINGEWWAILKDICDALNLRTNDVAQRLDPVEMLEKVRVEEADPVLNGVTFSSRPNGVRKTHDMLAINEQGIYEALFASIMYGFHIGDIVRVLDGSRSYISTLDGNYGRIVGFLHGSNRIEVVMRDFANPIGSRGTYYFKPEEIESVPTVVPTKNDINDAIQKYIDTDIAVTKEIYKEALNNMYGYEIYIAKSPFDIDKVIFNNPATIVFWADGTKTVVKANGDDAFVQEYGLAMAIVKKALGNKGNYYETIKKHCTDENIAPNKPKSVKVTRSPKKVKQ